MTLTYIKPTPILLKGNPQFTERWVQDRIVEDPSILGLGELELKDIERLQPKAGRLDLLLRDAETDKRYEVELMLGAVDESHIIRTIEYWDIERKRYPQYDHCAVIVAEDITSRFLNVIGLFNTAIPVIAIQMAALQVGDNILLNFTKVLDEIVLGEDDEDEDGGQVADRTYWEAKHGKESLQLLDKCIELIHDFAPKVQLNYKGGYVGLKDDNRTNNFLVFYPKKKYVRIGVRLEENEKGGWLSKMEEAGIPATERKSKRRINIQISADDLHKNKDLLKALFQASYEQGGD